MRRELSTDAAEHVVMAYVVMAYIVMASAESLPTDAAAHVVMAYVVMAYIVMASAESFPTVPRAHASRVSARGVYARARNLHFVHCSVVASWNEKIGGASPHSSQ